MIPYRHLFSPEILVDPQIGLRLFDAKMAEENAKAGPVTKRSLETETRVESKLVHHWREKEEDDGEGGDVMDKWFREEAKDGGVVVLGKPSAPSARAKAKPKAKARPTPKPIEAAFKLQQKPKRRAAIDLESDDDDVVIVSSGGGGSSSSGHKKAKFVPKIYAPGCNDVLMRVTSALMQAIGVHAMDKQVSESGMELRLGPSIIAFE